MSPEQLPHLGTFAKAAELNNFTAAARALRVTQAAVSQRIHALEEALGLALFRRDGGRLLLTEAGRKLYPYAQRILELHRAARAEVAGLGTLPTGELSLAASSVPGEHLLPDLLSRFRRRHPHVQVRATVADSDAVLRRVEQGLSHLGLVGKRGEAPPLEYRRFAADTLLLVVPPGHAWGRRERVSAEEFCREPLILREAGSGSRWCLEQALARRGRSPADLRVALELGSNEAIKEAVARGLGVAVLSRHAVRREVRSGALHALRVAGLPLTRDLFVTWDRRRVLPIPARLFLDMLGPRRARASTS